jgi:RHS repeat-associated protein
MFKRVLKTSGILIAVTLSTQVLAAGQGGNSPVNHPAVATTLAASVTSSASASALAPAQRQLAAPVLSSPWAQLHDELTRLSIASEQTRAAAGHVMAVGATVQGKTKARPLTPAELALEQASRRRILDLISQVQHSQQNVSAQFSANQAFIERHHFSARIAARQQATVAKFDQASNALAAVQQKLQTANQKNNHDAWHQGLEQLQQLVTQWQPAAPAQDAGHTPWTTPHLKVRAPHVDKSDYLQHLSLFDIKPLELAYAGNQPLPPGTIWPILPTMGESVVAGDTQASIDASLTPAIQAQAAALNHNPAQIYHWVHDHIAYVPYYGSLQGADFTLQSRRGNDVDSASLLISLLRASNIPARYVYGTITVPLTPAKNWLGGVPDANAALSLLAQGGVPSQGVEEGGSITALQLEHVWVEAYVDYVPSQGTVQQQSDTWIPMDASYQQHSFTAALNIPASVPFNAQGLLTQLNTSSTLNANGQIQNLNSGAVQAAITSYQQNIQTWMSNYPGNTVGNVLGNSSTQPEPSELLDHNLPYTLTTVAADFDSLPASLRWQWRLNLYGSATDQAGNSPQFSLKGDLPTLLGHRLSIGFRPSTPDDSQVLSSLLPGPHANGTPVLPVEYPQNVPAYLINMTPELYEDGQLIADAGASVTSIQNGASITTPASPAASTGFPLGTPLTLESAAYDPASQNWQTASDASISSSPSWTDAGSDSINSGETHVIALDSGMTSGLLASQQAALDALSAQLGSGNSASSYDSLTGVLLQSIGANYFGLLDAYEQWETSNQSLIGFRRLSWARIATEVDAQYAQGIILSASFPGAQIRLDHLETALVGPGGAAASIPYRLAATERLSVYSQTALQNSLQTLLPNGNPVSAVHALATALNQGQALNDLNSNTYTSLITGFPQPLSAAENTAVTNAVGAGQSVVLNPTPVSLSQTSNGSSTANAWTGRGLLYQDPNTGNSRFTVSNGATALWYDGMGSAWLAFASPSQVQNGSLPALTATRNLNVQLQTALGANQNLPWTQFSPANDLINGDLLSQLNAQTGSGSSSTQNLTSASPNLLPTAAGILATDVALSQSVNINLDAPPQISSNPGLTGSVTVPYSYAIQASSPQGKTLTYSLVSGPSQISVNKSGNLSWSKPLLGSWPITLRVSDGQTFSTQSWTLAVSQGAPALTVQLSVQPGQFVAAGSQLTVVVTTSGGLLPESAHLTVDGQDLSSQLLPGSNNGVLASSGSQTSTYIATLTASSTVGNHSLLASVSDGNQSITQSSLYAVSDSHDSAPVASITAPQIDATLTSPTPITGTATAGDLSYYQLLLKPVDAPQSAYVQIGKGTTAVSNGQLGTLDPSTLQNGIYTLALIVYNSQGQQTGVQQTLEIEKHQKAAIMGLSIADLSFTAPGGMPLQVTRTYSTLRKSEALDFGYGWASASQNVSIKANMPLGLNWKVASDPKNLQNCLVPVGAHNITISMPDGSTFNFQAVNSPKCLLVDVPQPNVVFQSVNTTATLAPVEAYTLIQQGNAFYDTNTGAPWIPSQFKLTLQNGTVFILDETFGIQKVTDKFGKSMSFSKDGMQSSDGQNITYTRDSQGRISAVTGPDGKGITYTYDASGNLGVVTDRLNLPSTYGYDDTHALTSYTDPSGNTLARYSYDDQGRLIGVTDANGNTTQITVAQSGTDNTPGNTETIKDKLGNVTTFTYDAFGDITKKVDALGNIWNYTFDENGNQTSETDPLGRVTTVTFGTNLNYPGSYDQVTKIVDHRGHSMTRAYDPNGNPITMSDPNGNTTIYENFGNGSVRVTTPGGGVGFINLDDNGSISAIHVGDQNQQFTHDTLGRATSRTDNNGTTTQMTYDERDNLLAVSSPRTIDAGLSTAHTVTTASSYTYDANGNAVTETDPLGRVRHYSYDNDNRLVSMTDEFGGVSQVTYDANSRPLQFTYPDGSTEAATYDALGNLLAHTDAGGHTTQYRYDALNRVSRVTYADGSYADYSYDAAGNLIGVADNGGHSAQVSVDGGDNPVSVTDALGNKSTRAYDANNNMTSASAPNGETWRFQYDTVNQLTQATSPSGLTASYTYDNNFHLASIGDPAGKSTSFQYNKLGRLAGVTLAGAAGDTNSLQTQFGYDETNSLVSQTDALGRVTRWRMNEGNQLLGRILPDGRQERFAYDAGGNNTQYIGFDGQSTYVAYDSLQRPTMVAAPDGRQVRYSYNADGLLTTLTSGSTVPTLSGFQVNGVTHYSYDSSHRLTQVSYPSGRYINYGYDVVGNLSSRSTADGSWQYVHDANGNVTKITDPKGQQTHYSYDSNGRRLQTRYADGSHALREYNSDGGLQQLAWQNGQGQVLNASVYVYNTSGHVQTLTRFDNQSLVQSVTVPDNNPVTGVVNSREHWALSNPAAVISYQYDFADRLVQEQVQDYRHNTEYITNWTYDGAGNRLSQSKTVQPTDASGNPAGSASTTTTAYTYDSTDRLQQAQTVDGSGATTTTTYGWDQNGRLIQKAAPSQLTQYTWRSDNRLIQVRQGTSAAALQPIASYQYDVGGNRTQRTLFVQDPANPGGPLVPQVTDYLVDDNFPHSETLEEIQTSNGNQSTRTLYTWGIGDSLIGSSQDSGAPSGSTQAYYEQDGLGSVITASDSAGAIATNYRYGAYGETYGVSSADTNAYRYAGEYREDSTGLEYHRERWYDPSIGRFISFDEFDGVKTDSISLNHYIYTSDEPVGNVDPDGYETLTETQIGFAVMGILTVLPTALNPNDPECSLGSAVGGMALGGGIATGTYIAFGAGGLKALGFAMTATAIYDLSHWPKLTPCQRTKDILGVVSGALPFALGKFRGRAGHAVDTSAVPIKPSDTIAERYNNVVNALKQMVRVSAKLHEFVKLNITEIEESVGEECLFSFAPDTLVETPRGTVTIDKLKRGDLVLARDENTGMVEAKKVLQIFAMEHADDVRVLTIEDGMGKQLAIVTTDHHRFHTSTGWKEANQFKVGDWVDTLEGGRVRLVGIRMEPHKKNPLKMFNLEVQSLHNYAISKDKVWVHNCGDLGGEGSTETDVAISSETDVGNVDSSTTTSSQSEGLIYRSASGTPTSMTPRVKDVGGLSAANSLENALPGKNQIIDTSKLTFLCAECDNPKTGHVSIYPKDPRLMQDWINSRGGDKIHSLTQELLDAVIGTVNK